MIFWFTFISQHNDAEFAATIARRLFTKAWYR